MDIKLLKNEGFTLSGSGILRAFQNEKMPSLDLLVREAIQNSMDARRVDKNFVKEEIDIDQFDVKKLKQFFPQIEELLYLKSKWGYNKFISISDKNTVGLTGPVRISDIEGTNWGRFLSLVQGIAKPQENQGAGGSWGYGKTVYYRIGIGLVIFYSRIQDGQVYKDRLMACLVENEKNENSILNHVKEYNTKTGVAWWGKKDEEFDNSIIPLENREDIENILSCFNLSLYEGEETGTRIIIPFINEKKLLNQTTLGNIEDYNVPYWCKSLEDYLKVSIQKWYPTKIMNLDGAGGFWNDVNKKSEINPALQLFINKKEFNSSEMLPLFSTIQDLYNYATKEDFDINFNVKDKFITIRKVFKENKPAGKLVYANLTKKELRMLEPDNEESPYAQINNERIDDENYSNVIIAFCRKPGMILRYSTDDEWVSGIVNPNKDTYVIALFIPNGYNEIEVKDNSKQYKINLEEYLRASEEADHNNWTDIGEFNYNNFQRIDVSNLRIIWKIQKGIKSVLKEELKVEEKEIIISVGTVLSRQLTKWFLPKKGFGKKATNNRLDNSNEIKYNMNKKVKRTQLELKSLEVSSENQVFKRFSIYVNENDLDIDYSFKVVTENEDIGANEWEGNMNKDFPIEIIKFEIQNIIYKNGTIKEYNMELLENNDMGISIEKKKTKISNSFYGFEIKVLNDEIININGKIFYKIKDQNVEIKIEREKVNINEQ